MKNDSGTPGKTPTAAQLEIYRQKYEQFRHLDRLRWQAPGIAFASGAILLAISGDKAWLPVPYALFLFGLISWLSAFMIYRIRLAIDANRRVLGEVASSIGDDEIPSMSRGIGATCVFGYFFVLLGFAAVITAVCLWCSSTQATKAGKPIAGETAVELKALQQVFILFYAIFWSSVASVQGKWKAFHLPLVFHTPQACKRFVLSVLTLNIVPLAFVAYVLWALSDTMLSDRTSTTILQIVVNGALPAFAVFGFYRLWIGIIEVYPDTFYASDRGKLPAKYRHVEPVYRTRHGTKPAPPFVDLCEKDIGWVNIAWATFYVLAGAITPWIPI